MALRAALQDYKIELNITINVVTLMRTKNKAFPEILDAQTFRIRWKIFLAAFKVALDVENPASPVKSICFLYH